MGYVAKKVIAIAFSLPKMRAILLVFLRSGQVEIFQKTEYDDISDFKFQGFSGQVHLVIRDKGQHALVVGGQLVVNINPGQEGQSFVGQ